MISTFQAVRFPSPSEVCTKGSIGGKMDFFLAASLYVRACMHAYVGQPALRFHICTHCKAGGDARFWPLHHLILSMCGIFI